MATTASTTASTTRPYPPRSAPDTYARNDSSTNVPDSISVRLLMLLTASVWMGCVANSRPVTVSTKLDADGSILRAATTNSMLGA